MTGPAAVPFDARRFRTVLGHYPTGVVVVTAHDDDGPAGMAVGSFTSVSLEPPLVAFLPDRTSSTWPRIRAAGSFCANILRADQEHICRQMAAKGADKFAGLGWQPASSGSPVLDGVVGWIDCDIDSVTEAGDHFIVLGRVRDLDIVTAALPLVFFQGGYGAFSSRTVAAAGADLMEPLRIVDAARSRMDDLARTLDVECLASAHVGEDLVLLASSGTPEGVPTSVGTRLPLVPPMGNAFEAWADDASVTSWLLLLERYGRSEEAAVHRAKLARVRERGYSMGVGADAHHAFAQELRRARRAERPDDPEKLRTLVAELGSDSYEPDLEPGVAYDVHTITAPVFGPDGSVVLGLSLFGLPSPLTPEGLKAFLDPLLRVASDVTAAIGGSKPAKEER